MNVCVCVWCKRSECKMDQAAPLSPDAPPFVANGTNAEPLSPAQRLYLVLRALTQGRAERCHIVSTVDPQVLRRCCCHLTIRVEHVQNVVNATW